MAVTHSTMNDFQVISPEKSGDAALGSARLNGEAEIVPHLFQRGFGLVAFGLRPAFP